MTAVVFDYTGWLVRYPSLSSTTQPTAQAYFNDAAALYLDNTDCSPVKDINRRAALLNLLVAHMATLASPAASGLVGRITNASEGSVAVASEYAAAGSGAWFNQTAPGAAFWQATAQYRTAQYVPAPFCRGRSVRGFWPW